MGIESKKNLKNIDTIDVFQIFFGFEIFFKGAKSDLLDLGFSRELK